MYIILVEDKELLVFQLGIENGRDFGKRALQRIKNCEKGQYSYPEFWGEIFTLSGFFLQWPKDIFHWSGLPKS